jgi:hypothetical protein
MKSNFGKDHDHLNHTNRDQVFKYTCPKCGNKQYEIGEMWAYSNFWTKVLQLHARRFTFLACQNCKFTEFYKVPKGQLGEVINFIAR